jgi:hypothetical protein
MRRTSSLWSNSSHFESFRDRTVSSSQTRIFEFIGTLLCGIGQRQCNYPAKTSCLSQTSQPTFWVSQRPPMKGQAQRRRRLARYVLKYHWRR